MPVDDKKQPIIVKKVKKHGHGHHGGAWKVAYADFVTAMMAFFLLMWMLGSTTEAQRDGISDYFQNPSAVQGPGGASTSMIKLGGALEMPRDEGEPLKSDAEPIEVREEIVEDKQRLDELMERLKDRIEQSPALQDFKDQLLLDITSEGLRIQIVDKENRPMFALGSARLKSYTQDILHEIGGVINKVPNHVSIAGHTDATPFRSGRADYSNWELSSDRANAARRELVRGGMKADKFGRVVGLADSVLFDKVDAYNPINRRISIIVLNKATERAIGLADDQPETEMAAVPEAPMPAAETPIPPVEEPVLEGADARVAMPPVMTRVEEPDTGGAGPASTEPAPTSGIPPEFAEPAPPPLPLDGSMESKIQRLLGPPPGAGQ